MNIKEIKEMINLMNENSLVELETEEDVHKVGVLYGAGHMPNLEHLIRSELGAELVDENWFTAWKIPRKSA